MSTEDDSDQVPVDVMPDDPPDCPEPEADTEEPPNPPELEKQSVSECEEKLKHAMADYQNLARKTLSDIENGVNAKTDELILDFLSIYDDFVLAKKVFSGSKVNADGLDSILKNMDSLLKKYNVAPIEAVGRIFDPNFHEAISVISDPESDDNTVTKEIRKGYISHKRVIRPTLVEISKNG